MRYMKYYGLIDGSDASLKSFLNKLPGVDAVGADARAARAVGASGLRRRHGAGVHRHLAGGVDQGAATCGLARYVVSSFCADAPMPHHMCGADAM